MSRTNDPAGYGAGRGPRPIDPPDDGQYAAPADNWRNEPALTGRRDPRSAYGQPADPAAARPRAVTGRAAPANPPHFDSYAAAPARAPLREVPRAASRPAPVDPGYGDDPTVDLGQPGRHASHRASPAAAYDDPRVRPMNGGAARRVEQVPARDYAPPQRPNANQAYDERGYTQGQPARANGGYQQPYAEEPAYAEPAQRGYQEQGYAQDGYGEEAEYEAEDGSLEQYEQEEFADTPEAPPSRSRKGLIVAGAVVVSVLIGGGLGLVYKMSGGDVGGAKPKVVAADKTPVKIAPDDPGGKNFDGSKKSIYERLPTNGDANAGEPAKVVASEEQPVDGDAAAADGSMAPKKVRTISVTPGEKISADASGQMLAAADENADPAADAAMPGIVMEGDGSSGLSEPVVKTAKKVLAQAPAVAADPAADASALEAKVAKKVAEKASSKLKVASAVPAADPAAVADQPAKPKKLKVLAAVAPAATPLVAAPSGGSGYVVQVASVDSANEALAKFADLQAKHGEVLNGMQPDIQAVDVGGKKKHRVRIGPAGSSQAAKDLCLQLTALGQSCIVAKQ